MLGWNGYCVVNIWVYQTNKLQQNNLMRATIMEKNSTLSILSGIALLTLAASAQALPIVHTTDFTLIGGI